MQVTELHEDMPVAGKAAVQEGGGLLGGPPWPHWEVAGWGWGALTSSVITLSAVLKFYRSSKHVCIFLPVSRKGPSTVPWL